MPRSDVVIRFSPVTGESVPITGATINGQSSAVSASSTANSIAVPVVGAQSAARSGATSVPSQTLDYYSDYAGNAFSGCAGALEPNADPQGTTYDYHGPWFAPEIPTLPTPTVGQPLPTSGPNPNAPTSEYFCSSRGDLTSALSNTQYRYIFCVKGSDLTNGNDNDSVTVDNSGSSTTPRWIIFYDPDGTYDAETVEPWNQPYADRVQMPYMYHIDSKWNRYVGLSWGIINTQVMRCTIFDQSTSGSTDNLFYRCNMEWGTDHVCVQRRNLCGRNTFYKCVTHDHLVRIPDGDTMCFHAIDGFDFRVISCEGYDWLGDFFHVEVGGVNGFVCEDCCIYRTKFYDEDGTPNPNGDYGPGEGAIDIKDANPDGTSIGYIWGNRILHMRHTSPAIHSGGGSGSPFKWSVATEYKKNVDIRWNIVKDTNEAPYDLLTYDAAAGETSNRNHSIVRNIAADCRDDDINKGVFYMPGGACEVYLNTTVDTLQSTRLWTNYRSDSSSIGVHDNMGNWFQDTGAWSGTSNWGTNWQLGYNAYSGTYAVANKTYPVGYQQPSKGALNMGNFRFRFKKLTGEVIEQIDGIVPTPNTPAEFRELVPGIGANKIGSRTGIGTSDSEPDDLPIIVQDDGSNTTGDGTPGEPYATLEFALSQASGGQTIEMRKSGGGTWTYNAYTTFDEAFSEGNEVTIRVRAGDRVNFYPTATGEAVWLLNGASYIIFDGEVGEMYVGNRALWNGTGGGDDSYPYNAVFRAQNNSHHFDVRGVHFSGASGSQAIEPKDDTHHYRFLRCTGYGHGKVTLTDVSDDGILIVGDNAIVEGCNLSAPFGGHNSGMFFGESCVYRNNTFYMNWPDYTDQSADTGYRAFALSRENSKAEYASQSPWGPSLCEGNLIRRAGHVTTTDFGKNANYKLSGRRTIFRYNYVFDCLGDESDVCNELLPQDPGHFTQHNTEYISNYHNTYDNNVNIHYCTHGYYDGNTRTNQNQRQYLMANNIHSNYTESGVNVPALNSPHCIWVRNGERTDLEGYSDAWKGAIYRGNIFDGDGFHVKLSDSISGTVDADSLAQAKTTWGNVFEASNVEATPSFVNPGAKSKAGFALQLNSPGENDAEPMTEVSAGITSDTISVDYAYWMYDGFDLSYFGEEGDWIAIYDSDGVSNKRVRQVQSVLSETSVQLTESVTVSAGDKIFAMLSDGVTVCKNIGAAQ